LLERCQIQPHTDQPQGTIDLEARQRRPGTPASTIRGSIVTSGSLQVFTWVKKDRVRTVTLTSLAAHRL